MPLSLLSTEAELRKLDRSRPFHHKSLYQFLHNLFQFIQFIEKYFIAHFIPISWLKHRIYADTTNAITMCLFSIVEITGDRRLNIISSFSRTKRPRSNMQELIYKETNSVALVRKRTIPTERPLLVGEVSANFSG
jgi:hypothetical protein